MSKLISEELFKKNLLKYSKGYLDISTPGISKFCQDYNGAILMLVPEAVALLVNNGLKNDPKVVFIAMAALAATLKEYAEIGLKDIEGGLYENCIDDSNVVGIRKLCN